MSESESEQTKEVYAHYGLAMYMASCLEHGLAILLATKYGPGPQKITRAQYDELLESLCKNTFGKLFAKLRQSIDVPEDLESSVKEAVEMRNWLAHHYFWEKAGSFMTKSGRASMIAELQDIVDFFEGVNTNLSQLSCKWLDKHGMREDDIMGRMERLIEES